MKSSEAKVVLEEGQVKIIGGPALRLDRPCLLRLYMQDLITTDRLCLDLVNYAGMRLTLHEEMVGFWQLLEVLDGPCGAPGLLQEARSLLREPFTSREILIEMS